MHFHQEIVAYSDNQGVSWVWLFDSTELLNRFNVSLKDLYSIISNQDQTDQPLLLLTSESKVGDPLTPKLFCIINLSVQHFRLLVVTFSYLRQESFQTLNLFPNRILAWIMKDT